MKVSSISDLKKELQDLPEAELVRLCLALAKYKKDNKEYLDYLLYAAGSKQSYVEGVKSEIEHLFDSIDKKANLYYVKKSLRKILRLVTKYSKYLGDKAGSIELLVFYCQQIKASGIPFRNSQLLVNLYEQQLKKINALLQGIHEDLRADYTSDLEEINCY